MNSIPTVKPEFAKNSYSRHYASLSELLATVSQEPKQPDNQRKYRSTSSDSRKGMSAQSWYGAQSREAAVAIINSGSPELAELVETEYAKLAPTLPRALSVRRKRKLGEQGDEVDIDALQRHDYQKMWLGFSAQIRQGISAIRIVVDVCGNFSENAQSLQRRGLAALCLSRILARAGYSVEIVAAICTQGSFSRPGKTNSVLTVTLKSAAAKPDVQQLAATVAFPGFFRTLGFLAIIHAADAQNVEVDYSLGQAASAESRIAANQRMLQIVTPTFNSDAHVTQWLKDAVAMFQGAKR